MDLSTIKVEVGVSEQVLNTINIGDKVDVTMTAVSDLPLEGTVSTVSPAAGQTGMYTVKIELPNEDGIIKAGCTVGEGGLALAAERMCADAGLEIDITGIKSSYSEPHDANILFGEVPGVLLQISESDFDYLDSQLILQDVAYYPIGRPTTEFNGLRFAEKSRRGVADILASLLGQATEGED